MCYCVLLTHATKGQKEEALAVGKSSSCSRARTACRLPAKAFAATVAHTGPTYYKLQLYVSLNIARIANAVVKVLKVVEVGLAWKALNPVQSVRNGRD